MSVGKYVFQNTSWAEHALSGQPSSVFQRLELVGDSVLSLVIVDALIVRYPLEREGDISRRRANLVSREICNAIGKNLNVNKKSNMADTVEAIIGAIYHDSSFNLDACRKWILHQWAPFLSIEGEKPLIDPKTALQELVQMHKLPTPVYEEVSRTGPDHNIVLEMRVRVQGYGHCTAKGRTKKTAEKLAASGILKELRSTMKPLTNGFLFPAQVAYHAHLKAMVT